MFRRHWLLSSCTCWRLKHEPKVTPHLIVNTVLRRLPCRGAFRCISRPSRGPWWWPCNSTGRSCSECNMHVVECPRVSFFLLLFTIRFSLTPHFACVQTGTLFGILLVRSFACVDWDIRCEGKPLKNGAGFLRTLLAACLLQ